MLRHFWFLVVILGLAICLPQPCEAGFDDLRKETLRVLGLDNDDLVSVAVLLSQFDDRTAEKLIGGLGKEEMESQFRVHTGHEMNSRVSQIVSRLANTSMAQGYEYPFQFKVLHNSQINAYALPAGHGYVNSGLLRIPMIRNDEIAFIIGHEMAHMIKRHGLSQLKRKYCLNLLTGRFTPKQGRAQFWSSMSQELFTARQSQKHEKEADQLGLAIAIETGYNPMAGLAFMRRLETLNRYRPGFQTQLQQFFQTHPPTRLRSTWLKDQALELEYGKTFREPTVEAFGSNSVLLHGPFPARNQGQAQKALRQYTRISGNKIYHFQDNPFAAYIGHCTWFCHGARQDNQPCRGNGGQWLGQGQAANWPTGSTPKVGSIMVWGTNTPGSGGCGHVALVVAVGNKWVEVWDSNYGSIRANGGCDLQVRHRRVTDFRYIIGYIYLKGTRSEPEHIPAPQPRPQPQPTPPPQPAPEPEPEPKPRTRIMIEQGPIHLGDDEMPLETAWSKQFRLQRYEARNSRIKTAALVMEVKGLPNKDPRFSINRNEIGVAITATDQWQEFRFSFKPSILKQGQNLIDIETVIAELYDSYDECQIRGIYLNLSYRR